MTGYGERVEVEIGIGLPATIPGIESAAVLDWAKRADQGPFSSLGIIDRIAYPNHEPLITLASAAGITTRIRLMTTVLVAPLRNPVLFAKQAATLDRLSSGRLVLGFGVGGRRNDFSVLSVPFSGRGKRLEEGLRLMRAVWRGEPVEGSEVGPPPKTPGGPPVLLGGTARAALARAGRMADGFLATGGGDAAAAKRLFSIVEQEWAGAHRSGRPRFVAAAYCALGRDVEEEARAYIADYYGFLGPKGAAAFASRIPVTSDEVRRLITSYRQQGVDELILWPCSGRLSQLDRFADTVAEET